ncbi:MAG: right-handed parallel beta-helix repeat-containing protein [Candidatus Thorarchaeota archaeon]|nr:right-handed parallel beta-helix repeat-containing protein [Candidatus Thorarchaeota archaeon]
MEGSYWTGNPLIRLTVCNNSHIVGNNVAWTNFQIINSNETQIKDNTLFKSKISISASADVLAEYNTIDGDDSANGIEIHSSNQCNVSHNTIANQLVDGITVKSSVEIIVRNNTISNPSSGSLNNDYGIYVEDSVGCIILNNTASKNQVAGIGIINSNSTLVYDNIAFNNERGFYDRGTLDTHFNNCLAYENTDCGYYVRESNRTRID